MAAASSRGEPRVVVAPPLPLGSTECPPCWRPISLSARLTGTSRKPFEALGLPLRVNVVAAQVLVLQVVGVLPDVNAQDRGDTKALAKGVVLVGA